LRQIAYGASVGAIIAFLLLGIASMTG